MERRLGYGYFVKQFAKPKNLLDASEMLAKGIRYKQVKPLLKFLRLSDEEIAQIIPVSKSTLKRWNGNTILKSNAASQFFKIDRVIGNGVKILGSEESLYAWLNSPIPALRNELPRRLLYSPISIDLVDEALSALAFGSFM